MLRASTEIADEILRMQHELVELRAKIELMRPVVEAAEAWRDGAGPNPRTALVGAIDTFRYRATQRQPT